MTFWGHISNCILLLFNIPYLPVYKSTFYCLKIGPKNRPRLIHGSKSEIKKLSGQISIIIVWYVNKQSTFTRYKFRCLFPAQLEQSKFKSLRLNKELIVAANKVVSPLDESHISCFEVLLLSNLALYRASARTLFSTSSNKMLVGRVFVLVVTRLYTTIKVR